MEALNEAKLVRGLTQREGEKQFPYRDTKGKLTIGVGRNLTDRGISVEESGYLLANDLKATYAGLDRSLPWWRAQPEGVQRALAELAFNLGMGGLLQFHRAVEAVQAGDMIHAAIELRNSEWAKDVGSARTDAVIAALQGHD